MYKKRKEQGRCISMREGNQLDIRSEKSITQLFYSFFGFSDSEVQPPNQLDSDLPPLCS